MCVRDNGDRIRIRDTIYFCYNCRNFVIYMSLILPNGEPEDIIRERHVAYSNEFNLTQRQCNNMHTILQTNEDYPAQIHCFKATDMSGNHLVGSLALQQYGSVLL
ncbi:hypothetical protein VPH35_106631 [Triticum aestivum]